MDFDKPTIEYAELWPMLVVFGVAVPRRGRRGVRAARAALPHPGRARRRRARSSRWPARSTSASTSTSCAAAGESVVARGEHHRRRDPRRRRPVGRSLGPGAGLRARRRPAVRRAPTRGRGVGVRRPGRGAAGHRGRARGVDPRARPHRGLPAADVRGRRHDAVPGRQRPAHHVRGARGALAAALPAVRAGPPAPAAQPGGRAQVLPARRVLLRLLPLRRRAHLRLRRLDAARRDQRGGPQRHLQPVAAADRHGHARRRPAVQGRRRAVPGLDARRLPGRAHRGHRRSWRPAPRSRRSARCCGCSTSPSARTAGTGSR